jgi:hypothetical protein
MRLVLKLSVAAFLISGLIGSAAAQTSSPASSPAAGQGGDNNWLEAPGGPGPSAWQISGAVPGTDNVSERLSDGTLAESANTTALASSTYHQPTGFLPGMKP